MVKEAVTAYVALGANLGRPEEALLAAMQSLDALPGTRVIRRSSLYRSAPVQAVGPDFINAVVELSTHLAAPALLKQLQGLEQVAGRQRPYLHAPRTLDLDLLLYGEGRIDSATLVVPHPRMGQRAFVLLPLAEIAPALVGAQQLANVSGQSIERLVARVPDPGGDNPSLD
jgi:2-amino-4-hydroxy-6-hydroxymethyldihydropteridine diphosphokinase